MAKGKEKLIIIDGERADTSELPRFTADHGDQVGGADERDQSINL